MPITFGPQHNDHSPAAPRPTAGTLLREPCPPPDAVRFYAVDTRGFRCFEVTVRASLVTPELIARLRDDAAMVAGPHLALVDQREALLRPPTLPHPRR